MSNNQFNWNFTCGSDLSTPDKIPSLQPMHLIKMVSATTQSKPHSSLHTLHMEHMKKGAGLSLASYSHLLDFFGPSSVGP